MTGLAVPREGTVQRKPEFQAILKAMGFCLVCLTLLAVMSRITQAQDHSTVPLSEAMLLANREHIPNAARALASRGNGDSAALWARAAAGQALLQHQLSGSEAAGFEIVSRSLVVPVEVEGK
jgi:hypothetical protein